MKFKRARNERGRNMQKKIVINDIELGFVNEGWFRMKEILDTGKNFARINWRRHSDGGMKLDDRRVTEVGGNIARINTRGYSDERGNIARINTRMNSDKG